MRLQTHKTQPNGLSAEGPRRAWRSVVGPTKCSSSTKTCSPSLVSTSLLGWVTTLCLGASATQHALLHCLPCFSGWRALMLYGPPWNVLRSLLPLYKAVMVMHWQKKIMRKPPSGMILGIVMMRWQIVSRLCTVTAGERRELLGSTGYGWKYAASIMQSTALSSNRDRRRVALSVCRRERLMQAPFTKLWFSEGKECLLSVYCSLCPRGRQTRGNPSYSHATVKVAPTKEIALSASARCVVRWGTWLLFAGTASTKLKRRSSALSTLDTTSTQIGMQI